MISFLKLDVNIIHDSKIKIILRMPEGSELFRLWISMLCLGMKSSEPGVLLVGDSIPYTDELLSNELTIDLPIVRMGLQTFQELKMIEVIEIDDQYCFLITNFEKHQNLDKIRLSRELTRKRVQKHRLNKKNLQLNSGKNEDVTRYTVTRNANVTQQTKTKTEKKTKTKTKTNSVEYSKSFEEFWQLQINKTGKGYAFFCWKKACKTKHKNDIIAAWKNQIEFYQRRMEEKDCQPPNPSTWLNQGRWDDEHTNGRIEIDTKREWEE